MLKLCLTFFLNLLGIISVIFALKKLLIRYSAFVRHCRRNGSTVEDISYL